MTVEPAPLEATRYVNAATYEQHITPESPNIGLSEVVVNPAILESRSVTMSKSTETFYPLSSSSYGISQITISLPSLFSVTSKTMPESHTQQITTGYPVNYFPTSIYIENSLAANNDTSGRYCLGDALMLIQELQDIKTTVEGSDFKSVYGSVWRSQSMQFDFDFVANFQIYINSVILDRTAGTITISTKNELYIPGNSTYPLTIYIWSRLIS